MTTPAPYPLPFDYKRSSPPEVIRIPIGHGITVEVPVGITRREFEMMKGAIMLYRPMFVLPDPPYEPDYQI